MTPRKNHVATCRGSTVLNKTCKKCKATFQAAQQRIKHQIGCRGSLKANLTCAACSRSFASWGSRITHEKSCKGWCPFSFRWGVFFRAAVRFRLRMLAVTRPPIPRLDPFWVAVLLAGDRWVLAPSRAGIVCGGRGFALGCLSVLLGTTLLPPSLPGLLRSRFSLLCLLVSLWGDLVSYWSCLRFFQEVRFGYMAPNGRTQVVQLKS